MTDDERDELIEKSLLKELDVADEARVQQLRRDDALFREEYNFQEKLVQQVQLKRRQELLRLFADFDTEQGVDTVSKEPTPVMPLSVRSDSGESQKRGIVIFLWQHKRAASILFAIILGAVVWGLLSKYDPKPIADAPQDSTRNPLPKDTTLRSQPIDAPRIQQQAPQGPVAQKTEKPRQLQGAEQLPYSETDNISLGFGKNGQTTEYRTVIFRTAPEPSYVFEDTLTVYLPTLPAAKPAWSLVYSRSDDTYYLTSGKTRYELSKGLQGRQPLKKVN